MKLIHFDDKKEKWQSHEVKMEIEAHEALLSVKDNIYSYDITDIEGYGATKEEALDDYKKKINILTNFYNKYNEKIQNITVEELEEKE